MSWFEAIVGDSVIVVGIAGSWPEVRAVLAKSTIWVFDIPICWSTLQKFETESRYVADTAAVLAGISDGCDEEELVFVVAFALVRLPGDRLAGVCLAGGRRAGDCFGADRFRRLLDADDRVRRGRTDELTAESKEPDDCVNSLDAVAFLLVPVCWDTDVEI
jgi:hypothetical protein